MKSNKKTRHIVNLRIQHVYLCKQIDRRESLSFSSSTKIFQIIIPKGKSNNAFLSKMFPLDYANVGFFIGL